MPQKYYIHGTGFYVPERVLTNKDLEAMVETSDEWITSRTGIKERRIAAPDQATSDLALIASQRALEDAGMQASELTHILLCSVTPDTYCPSAACWLEHKLGVKGVIAQDINAACSGFLFGLETARAMLALKPDSKVLLVAAEKLSSRTNFKDRATCVLFGDGAGAAIISTKPEGAKAEIVDIELGTDGEYAPLLTIKGGGSAFPYGPGERVNDQFFIEMQGRETFKIATRTMVSVARQVLERNNMKNGDLDLIIPHQANERIIRYVGEKLGYPAERMYLNLDKYGNTSAASVGIALDEALRNGVIKPGHKVLIVTFGGGLTWGAGLIKFF